MSGNRFRYPGNVATPTGSLKLLGLVINSTLSRPGARFACFDIKNFYLGTPMEVGHKLPVKKQLSPHRCREITYGSKVKQAPKKDSYSALDEKGVLWVQRIVGALIYYARAVNNKLLVAISEIGGHQASASDCAFRS